MNAQELMSSPVITVSANLSIQEVARIMRDNAISGVPVVDSNQKLLGVVTELELISRNTPPTSPGYIPILSGMIPTSIHGYHRYREQLQQILATTAGELMREIEPIYTTTDLETIMIRMNNPEETMLPVVEEGKVVGVVTRTDLVRLIEQLEVTTDHE